MKKKTTMMKALKKKPRIRISLILWMRSKLKIFSLKFT